MASSDRLRGLSGQYMAAKKAYRDAKLRIVGLVDVVSGSGSVTTTRACQALIYAFGPGGSGEQGANPAGGAGGGGALFKRLRLGPNQIIAWTVGTPGAGVAGSPVPGNDATDTTVNAGGVVLRAGGGKGGGTPTGIGGKGGAAFGGDVNRPGGDGGSGAASGGSGGTGGGAGGTNSAGDGGGGGGAGFGDDQAGFVGGAGSAGNAGASSNGASPGGGSGGAGGGGTNGGGGNGRVYVLLLSVN